MKASPDLTSPLQYGGHSLHPVQFNFQASSISSKGTRSYTTTKQYEKRTKGGITERTTRGPSRLDNKSTEKLPSLKEDPSLVLPPVVTLSTKSRKTRSIQRPLKYYDSLQGSYTTLSALNKTAIKRSEDVAEKTKLQLGGTQRIVAPQEKDNWQSPSVPVTLSAEENQLSRQKASKEIAEKVDSIKQKLEAAVNVTDVSHLESAKMFAKCFLSALHSSEENIQNSPSALAFIANTIYSLFKNSQSFLDLVNKTIKELKETQESNQKTIKSLRFELEAERAELESKLEKEKAKYESKPLAQELKKLKEKHTQYKISTIKERKDLGNQISLLQANNNALTESLKSLKEETDIVRMTTTIQQLRNELHQTQEVLKKEKEERSNIGFKLYTLLDASKKELKERDVIIGDMRDEYNRLLVKHNKVCDELSEARIQMKENTENMKMTQEDMLCASLRLKAKQNEILKYDAQVKELSSKVNELELQLKLEREGLIQKKEVSLESTLFYFVSDNPPAKRHTLNKAMSREGKMGEFGELKETNDKVAETVAGEVQLDTVAMKKYKFLRPTYRALIDSLLPQAETAKVTYSPAFPVWLQVVVRAIFDAKFNEMLVAYNKGKGLSKFPEFVYAWLGTFCIDKETHNVRLLEYTEKDTVAPENRKNLLLGLEAAEAAKLWEIAIFKDFLEETLSLDELAFFLHCRFLMFKGPQLVIPTAGFCVTHFVAKDRVNDTIDRVLYKYRTEERKDLKRKLIEFNKQTYKDPNAFDYAMVLRILLELYRKEKKESFVRLEELFILVRKNQSGPRSSLPFDLFYRVFSGDYDKAITDLEVAHLYREAFIGGGCNVNIDSTILTLCETPFWLRYLRLRGQNSEPKYDSRGDIDQNDDKGKECMLVYKHWEENESFFAQLKQHLIEFGCPDYLTYMETLEGYIRWKGKEDSAKFMGKSMLQVYRLLWILVMELWCANEEKLQFTSDAELKHDLVKELSIFTVLKNMFATKMEGMSKNNEKKKVAAAFEKTLIKATQGTDLLAKIQDKIREEDSSPRSPNRQSSPRSWEDEPILNLKQ